MYLYLFSLDHLTAGCLACQLSFEVTLIKWTTTSSMIEVNFDSIAGQVDLSKTHQASNRTSHSIDSTRKLEKCPYHI